MAQSGLSVPTYAYALNNPLRYVDRNGKNPAILAPAAGAVLAGGLLLYYLAKYTMEHPPLLPPLPTDVFAKKRPGSLSDKPDGCPTGTKPIDGVGWGKEKIHGIKDAIGAGPKDWVGVDPEGNIWSHGEDGAENWGTPEDLIPGPGK